VSTTKQTSAYTSRYSGFRCYYRSATGRLVPHRSGGHYYANGMYSTRKAAFVSAEREAAKLNGEHPERRYQVYEV
jgi:hypothetical protein